MSSLYEKRALKNTAFERCLLVGARGGNIRNIPASLTRCEHLRELLVIEPVLRTCGFNSLLRHQSKTAPLGLFQFGARGGN